MPETVRVVARVQARKGHESELRQILASLVEPTRREPGCVRYELLAGAQDPGDFVFVEEWASDADLDAHFRTPHLQAALTGIPAHAAGPAEVRRYRLAT